MYCRSCKKQIFSVLDNGERVCTACGTQSQDFIVDVVEWDPNLSTRVTIKKTRTKETRTVSSETPSISPNEAFQRILKLQVEALIQKFNCVPELYSVVGKLWIDFLVKSPEQKTRKSPSSTKDSSVVTHTNELDENASLTFDQNITRLLSDEFNSEQNKNTQNQNEQNNKNHPLENTLTVGSLEDPSDDDNYDNESPFEDNGREGYASDSEAMNLRQNTKKNNESQIQHYSTDGDDNPDDDDDNDDESVNYKNRTSRKKNNDLSFTRLGVPKLSLSLCFLYLACLWLRERVLLRDLIVWTREERLPFVSAVKTLPKNMRKIFLCRPFYFPTSSYVLRMSKKLSHFLDFHPPPHNPLIVFTRFYCDLSFPLELLPCTLRLWERNKPILSLHSKIPMYATLMAYVIITLKLCYGFDDKNRTKISDKYNFYKNLSIRTLQEWFDHRINLLSTTQPQFPFSLRELRSLSQQGLKSYLEFCKKQVFSEDEEQIPHVLRDLKDLLESAVERSMTTNNRSNTNTNTSTNTTSSCATTFSNESPQPLKKRKVTLNNKSYYFGPASQYVIYKSDSLGEFHQSYLFLLQICASYIHTPVAVLQKAVHTAEKEFLKTI